MSITIIPVAYPSPSNVLTSRASRDITDFVIHHTAGALTQMPLDIDREHRAIGDAMIAYNWVITPDGKIYAGRPCGVIGAATFGRNPEAVAAVLVGNFEPGSAGFTGNPTPEQLVALEDLCLWAHLQYPSIARTYGHGDVAAMFYNGDSNYATACPGKLLRDAIPAIRAYVAKRMVAH